MSVTKLLPPSGALNSSCVVQSCNCGLVQCLLIYLTELHSAHLLVPDDEIYFCPMSKQGSAVLRGVSTDVVAAGAGMGG